MNNKSINQVGQSFLRVNAMSFFATSLVVLAIKMVKDWQWTPVYLS